MRGKLLPQKREIDGQEGEGERGYYKVFGLRGKGVLLENAEWGQLD